MKKYLLIFIVMIMLALTGCNKEYDFVMFEGQDTVEINTLWEDAGAALDMKTYWKEADTNGNVDTSVLGLYEIIYTLTYDEVEYTATRYITVVDQISPEITLNPGIDSLSINDTWIDAGAIVTDNLEEELTIIVNGIVDTTTAGIYEIVYSSEDSSGNTVTITRYVTVFE
jgi:hypothetical protein